MSTGDQMREIAKAAISLPWAISMFGMQQMANLIAPPQTQRAGDTMAALDAVSSAAEAQLDGWLKRTYTVGNGLQRGVIDLMMFQAPDFDSSVLMRLMSEMQGGPVFQFAMNYMMPPMGWISSFTVAAQDGPAVQQEFANKLYIVQLVTQVEAQLGLDPGVHVPLPVLVARADSFPTFPRLWAIEGLGNYYAERAWERTGGRDPQDLLTDASTAGLPPCSMTMLHAGIGMSFANRLLRHLDPQSPPPVVRQMISRFANLCRRSSRPGYTGAAYESLGLATRTLYPNLVSLIDRELPAVEPGLVGYFWHGAGRAIYFDPTTMLPSFNAPWRAIDRIERDAPHEVAYLNLLSGFSWAITVVNMRNPSVMETFLRHHATTLARTPAFTNGVTSSLLMRFDTTPDDPNIEAFVRNQSPDADLGARSAWEALVSRPCTGALSDTYPRLRQGNRLEELFHFRP